MLQAAGSKAEILTPGTLGYEESIKRWSDTCEKRADATIHPVSIPDIQTILAFARTHSTPFVIRGGGHSTSGASATSSGFVLDLSQLRAVTVDPAARTITAGGGTTWADVDGAAAAYGLATVGGTFNHTGVGGYGHLSGRHGLTIDNLLAVQMVLADGSYATASARENADLFWAVRGAGQNFGVVTQFVFRAHPQPGACVWRYASFSPGRSWAGWCSLRIGSTRAMMGISTLLFGFSAPPPRGVPVVVVVVVAVFYNGTEEAGREFFKPLFELGPVADMTRSMPYEELNGVLNEGQGFGGRKLFGGGNFTLPLEPGLVEKIRDDFMAFISAHEDMGESIMLFEGVPFKKIIEVANDATSFANRGEYYNVATCFKWYDEALDGEVRAFSKALLKKASEDAGVWKKRKQGQGVGQYANYAELDNDAAEMFGKNTARLLELKQKYDPENMFRSHWLVAKPAEVIVH
ncbi:FAD binding oxidoreductase [Mytilinidion resinicola]|uniref:FAD binding oxidoreductase n=1 Tax=Mytilinidion resinicola TaxID=574789 RepID=A0A6A6Z1Y6_9PEZI|nr:FAD binding oxidoreductase [Mytilinidion resinicola]KAF2815010.1 FAD binding oxidoreductase [Mytilinidion resinicola]